MKTAFYIFLLAVLITATVPQKVTYGCPNEAGGFSIVFEKELAMCSEIQYFAGMFVIMELLSNVYSGNSISFPVMGPQHFLITFVLSLFVSAVIVLLAKRRFKNRTK